MKKITLFYLFTIALILSSCSNHLDESRVKKIIEESITDQEMISTKGLVIGEMYSSTINSDDKYKKLEAEGMIVIEQDDKNGKVNISLTDKAKEYIENIKEEKNTYSMLSNKTYKVAICRIFTYEIESVSDIHENPSDNTATAKVTLKKVNKTPFYEALEKDKTEYTKITMSFFKTTENEWKLKTKN